MELTQDLLQSFRWRNIGPFKGGRCVAVNGHPTEAATFYMGCVGACGRPRTAGHTGRTSRTGTSRPQRWALLRYPTPTPTSSMWGWASPAWRCRGSSGPRRRTACTGQRTAGAAGPTSGSLTRSTSPASAFTGKPRPGVRGGARPPGGSRRRARRVPLKGRRGDMGAGAVPVGPGRRHRHVDRPQQPPRAVRFDVDVRRSFWWSHSGGPGTGIFRATTAATRGQSLPVTAACRRA